MDTASIPSPATAVAAASASAATEPTKSPDDNANTNDDDRQQQDGTALSTFSQYQPSALPLHIMERYYRKRNNSDSSLALQQEQSSKTSAILIPSHTSPACESNLLSSVPAPRLHNIDALAANFLPLLQQLPPALSPLQLEGVLLALQRHKRIFRNGERAGFFIGDGAGIGKGKRHKRTFIRSYIFISQGLSHNSFIVFTAQGAKLRRFSGTVFVANHTTTQPVTMTIIPSRVVIAHVDTPNDTCGYPSRAS